MKTLLTTLLLTLTLLLTACGFKGGTALLTDSTIETPANTEVTVPAIEGADSYHWRQLSGISVEISDPEGRTLAFTAPSVTQEERLVFELNASFGDTSRTAKVTVIVHPLTGGDDNGTTDGNDDNSTDGGDTNTSTPDTTPPILTLNGENNITLALGETYTELGATAMDERDGRLSVAIIGDVNSSQIGSYTLTYSATDRAGNEANVTRTVHIVLPPDTTPPILTLNGENNVTLIVGDTYTELGATAMDERDGRLSVAIIGDVNSSQIGTYTLTYTATDRAGNRSSTTRTVTILPATLTGLTLTVDATSLNKDANTTLKVEAVYSDQTTKDVTDQVEWLIDHPDAIQIQSHTLTAKQDKAVTLRAKLDSQTSNAVTLDLYWEVNGHRLPPEPDPAVNNATLLGVDINGNGVRDDVERWIYEEYKDKHPIHIDIAMQAARGNRLILEKQPQTKEDAKNIMKTVDAATDCQAYYKYEAKYFNEPILIRDNAVDEYFRSKIYFNTKERMDTYDKYDTLLSGDSYTLLDGKEMQNACDFNTSKYDKE